MPVTAAVVGCGDISSVHLDALTQLSDVDLIAVCDVDAERRQRAAAAHDVPGFASAEAMLADLRPDVVHVTTPHHRHVEVALAALDAGCHVLLEKPVAQTARAAEPLLAAAAGASTKIGVCLQNRYNPGSLALHSLLDDGALGDLTGAWASLVWTRTADYYRRRPWRGSWDEAGGGVLINQAIHTLDLLQWFCGEVTDTEGTIAARLFPEASEVEDTAELSMTHVGGRRSSFWATLGSPCDRPVQLGIAGSEGTAVLEGDLTLTRPDGRSETIARASATASVGRAYWGNSHAALIADFYAKLDDPEPFWLSPAEAMKSLRIIDDVYEASGRRPPVQRV